MNKRVIMWVLCAVVSFSCAHLSAQNSKRTLYRNYPVIFGGIQGGGQSTLDGDVSFSDGITPVVGAYVGGYFNPVFGGRILVHGWEAMDDLDILSKKAGKYQYISGNVDLMMNLTNLFFRKSDRHLLDVFVFGGFGINKAIHDTHELELLVGSTSMSEFDYVDHNRPALVGRAGLIFDINLSKHISINLEGSANYIGSRSQRNCSYGHDFRHSRDWLAQAMIGLTYKFGKVGAKQPKVEAPAVDQSRALSLYEQMQHNVGLRMDNYMKRMKGESKADYLKRTSADSLASIRLKFEREESSKLAGNLINEATATFGKYSKNGELLSVDFNTLPSIMLGVKKNDLNKFTSAEDLEFRNTVYMLHPGDKFEVLYTEVLNKKSAGTYEYDNYEGSAPTLKSSTDFMPFGVVKKSMDNDVKLAQIRDRALSEARNTNYLSENTVINVASEVIPAGANRYDYKVSCKYEVKDGFSVMDDFAPGKYEAENSKASVAMLNIIKEAFDKDFATYLRAGAKCKITFTGAADAMPIHGVIAYNGKYGDIVAQDVTINGVANELTVTKKDGIRSNEQLSLVRAMSVKDYIYKNVPELKKMNTSDVFDIEVSKEKGSEFRRVKVEFYFEDAFK